MRRIRYDNRNERNYVRGSQNQSNDDPDSQWFKITVSLKYRFFEILSNHIFKIPHGSKSGKDFLLRSLNNMLEEIALVPYNVRDNVIIQNT